MPHELASTGGLVMADGFACVRIDVKTTPLRFGAVVGSLKTMKEDLKRNAQGLIDPFPDRLLGWLRGLPGVVGAVVQPPVSAILVPVHLIRRYADRPVLFSGALGCGPVSEYIREMMAASRITCRWAVCEGSDSPIEVGIRDGVGQEACVRLYLPKKLKHRFAPPARDVAEASAFVLSVFNQGRARVARQVRDKGGFASLRVGELGRHVSASDYLGILETFHQVVIPTREYTLRQVAKAAGYNPPRGWPRRFDPLAHRLADDLAGRGTGRLVVLLYHEAQEAAFVRPGGEPVVVRAPERYQKGGSRASRLHGACAALVLKQPSPVPIEGYVPTAEALGAFADLAMQVAYAGTDRSPLEVPGPEFRPAGSWLGCRQPGERGTLVPCA